MMMGKKRGAREWIIWHGKMLACIWRDKKVLNLLTNYFSRPHTVKHSRLGKIQNTINHDSLQVREKLRVPNVIACYRATQWIGRTTFIVK